MSTPVNFPFIVLLSILAAASSPQASAARGVPRNAQFQPVEHGGSWGGFEQLVDAQRGSRLSGVPELKRYLHRFGYLPFKPLKEFGGFNFSDEFDEELESAVSLYQSKLKLPVSGKLDAATLSEMMTPRCGMDDRNMRRNSKHLRRYAFFSGRPSWHGVSPLNLTYGFFPSNFINYIPEAEVKAAFRRAFARWAEVIPVKFLEVEDYWKAKIKVGFYGGDHGDGEPFDGVLGVLGHAFSPENGRLHLDMAERWAVDFEKETSPVAVDLESVATHEIGHVLGLAHSSVKEAVMYPSLSPRKKKLNLRRDDVEGVQLLYGSNPNFRLDSFLAAETSAAVGTGSRIHLVQRGCLCALTLILFTAVL